ncbi:MAG: cofactor-independent phosphoglycerate mutase [Candidatus Omnitrophica bacterium]|nr:cofactor-independent phosphoglycerate mutase [Candidatus Omnitrophota bacterium]MBD3268908.1 cofactor-independent phosphoglycerate mutase [Candidatus Omnitrophota bacterium]
MKYIIIVPDGAADYPVDILGGKTPLEVAEVPFMDSLAGKGLVGRVKTVPKGFTPSSDVANLSLLGYDPKIYYSGRGPLEAANLGVEIGERDLAFRFNLVTEAEGKISDYSAGHINNREAKILTDFLNQKLGSERLKFYFGTSYRNLLLIKGGKDLELDKLEYCAPHDIMGKNIKEHFPSGKNSNIVVDLMKRSRELLESHEINKVRIDLGENPANMIWLWGGGSKPVMPLFKDKFGLRGAVISAVDLIKGIGKIIGLEVIEVEGANGYYDTNYKGKAEAALKALEECDFVFIHIEATDEAGHNQDLRMKITCIERIDKLVLGTLLKGLKDKDFRILITPDHPTPLSLRTHTDEPVPFIISGKGVKHTTDISYTEIEAQGSPVYFDKGADLLAHFLKSEVIE